MVPRENYGTAAAITTTLIRPRQWNFWNKINFNNIFKHVRILHCCGDFELFVKWIRVAFGIRPKLQLFTWVLTFSIFDWISYGTHRNLILLSPIKMELILDGGKTALWKKKSDITVFDCQPSKLNPLKVKGDACCRWSSGPNSTWSGTVATAIG